MNTNELRVDLNKAINAGDEELADAIAAELERSLAADETAAGKPLEWDFDAGEMAKNFPGDAADVAMQIADVVAHPIDTVQGLWNVALGFAQKLVPGEQEKEQYANMVLSDLAEKYGGLEEFQRQLQMHPAETLFDASTIITGGGALAAKAGVKGARAVQALGDIPGTAKRAGQVAWSNVRDKASFLKKPQELWESAIKPSTVLPYEKRLKMADTALRERLKPTSAGMKELRTRKAAAGAQLEELISKLDQDGVRFTMEDIVQEVKALKREWKTSPSPETKTYGRLLDRYMTQWVRQVKEQKRRGLRDSEYLKPSEVQQIKKDLYQQIDYEKLNSRGVKPKEDTQKRLAKGARKALEEADPRLAGVNQQFGDLAKLEPILERASNRIGNRDSMGIGIGVNAAGGGAVGGVPLAVASTAASFLDRPIIKATRAQRLYDAMQNGFMLNPGHGMLQQPFGLGAHNLGYLQDYSGE